MLVHYGNTVPHKDKDSDQKNDSNLSLPVLGEVRFENLPPENAQFKKNGSFLLYENEYVLFGFTKTKIEASRLKETAENLYRELFEITKGAFLYRVWNYLPQINFGEGDQERYKQFCEGRSNAFHETFGEEHLTFMPAGSCVGIDGDELVIYFLAGAKCPDHHENPNQVPAYRYPRQYGPRSPSFARATSIHLNQKHYSFISGTAAVLGYESQGNNDLQRQLKVTCDNLELISGQISNSVPDSKHTKMKRNGKVYLRNSNDYEEARNYLKFRFSDLVDSLIFLRSDICRKELLIEIELLFVGEESSIETT